MASDLAEALSEIAGDYRRAQHATAIPGFHGSLWKYRCASSDMAKGQSAGFRILAWIEPGTSRMYLLCVYTHKDYPNQPPASDIVKWIKNALASAMAEPEGG